jgi:hypothetical protein
MIPTRECALGAGGWGRGVWQQGRRGWPARPPHGKSKAADSLPLPPPHRSSPDRAVVGPIVGPLLGGGLSQALGWRSTFVAMAICGGAIFLALLFFMEEVGGPAGRGGGEGGSPGGGQLSSMRCRSPHNWPRPSQPRTPRSLSRPPLSPFPPNPKDPPPPRAQAHPHDGGRPRRAVGRGAPPHQQARVPRALEAAALPCGAAHPPPRARHVPALCDDVQRWVERWGAKGSEMGPGSGPNHGFARTPDCGVAG